MTPRAPAVPAAVPGPAAASRGREQPANHGPELSRAALVLHTGGSTLISVSFFTWTLFPFWKHL